MLIKLLILQSVIPAVDDRGMRRGSDCQTLSGRFDQLSSMSMNWSIVRPGSGMPTGFCSGSGSRIGARQEIDKYRQPSAP